MMPVYTLNDVNKIVNGSIILPQSGDLVTDIEHLPVTGISTDSRSVGVNELFIAISGENFDGHDFVHDVFSLGALGAMVSETWYREKYAFQSFIGPLVVVSDIIDALQALATAYRKQFEIDVVGVTGSFGKTTTKEMIAAILGRRYKVFKTPGNLNSQIGLPQVLFQLDDHYDIAVLEMGMNHAGELGRLARMARPNVSVITNVGPAHLEFLKTLEGVGRAKGEILDYLPENGTAILNADDANVMAQRFRTSAKIKTFGLNEGADIYVQEIEAYLSGTTFWLDDGTEIHLNLLGKHQVTNALAAIMVGKLFDIGIEDIKMALASMAPTAMRMDIRKIRDVRVINDAYNANPVSARAALQTLALTDRGRRIAVLGDMLELGEGSEDAHRLIGQSVVNNADFLITVGAQARFIAEGARKAGLASSDIMVCDSNQEASTYLIDATVGGDTILIKGSRGMKMEEIVAEFEAHYGMVTN